MDMSEFLQVGFRSLLSLVTLFLVTKLIGKKQVSQLSLFDYVIGISIGNFAAEMTINLESHFMAGTLAVLIYGLVAYLIAIVTMKSIVLRRFFMGKPTMLIKEGIILQGGLKSAKFDVNDLLEQCRSQGYFDVSEIAFGLLEADGKLSILPKGENKPVTIKDLQLKSEKSSICANVVIDGNIMQKNLNEMGKDKDWLLKQLKVKGKDLNSILLATLDSKDKLLIYEKNNSSAADVFE